MESLVVSLSGRGAYMEKGGYTSNIYFILDFSKNEKGPRWKKVYV